MQRRWFLLLWSAGLFVTCGRATAHEDIHNLKLRDWEPRSPVSQSFHELTKFGSFVFE